MKPLDQPATMEEAIYMLKRIKDHQQVLLAEISRLKQQRNEARARLETLEGYGFLGLIRWAFQRRIASTRPNKTP